MTERTELNDREELILHAIVHTYITTAEAVGSRAIVRRFSLNLSPATVRNVMADLEEGGFLAHLHTSSGRVPADRGYRYYVDYLMHVHELSPEEQARIDEDLGHGIQDAEAVMRQASHLLASLSRQTGIVEAPSEQEAELRRIEVVPLTANRVAVMLADSYGRVRTTPVTIEEGFPMVELPRVNRFLNDHLAGVAVDKLKTVIQGKLQNLLDEQRQLASQAIRLLERLPKREPGEVFLDGTTQLFEQPEFRDIAKAREVFGLFEERHRLAQLLHALMTQGESSQTTVVIGSETREQGLEEISLVASPYRVGGKLVGMVGVLGPRRMPYSRLTSVVTYTAGSLSRLLTRLAG